MIHISAKLVIGLLSLMIILTLAPQQTIAIEYPLELVWEKTYGGTGDEVARAIMPTPDAGYLLAGRTTSSGAGDSDGWVVKIDSQGNQIWNRTYGGPEYDIFVAGIATSTGYVVVGRTNSYAPGDTDPRLGWIVGIDEDGQVKWEKTYGWDGNSHFRHIAPANGDGYVIAGVTDLGGSNGIDYWMLKTDVNGDLIWNTTLGGKANSNSRGIYRIVAVNDGYVVFGNDFTSGLGSDGLLVKIGEDGQVIWEKTFELAPSGRHDWCEHIISTSDGGYLLACNSDLGGENGLDTWLIKTDENGNQLWDTTISNSSNTDEFPNHLLELPEGGYLISIHSRSSYGDNLFVKLDETGAEEWRQKKGYVADTEFAWDLELLDDGAAGFTRSIGVGGWDMWVFEMNFQMSVTDETDTATDETDTATDETDTVTDETDTVTDETDTVTDETDTSGVPASIWLVDVSVLILIVYTFRLKFKPQYSS